MVNTRTQANAAIPCDLPVAGYCDLLRTLG